MMGASRKALHQREHRAVHDPLTEEQLRQYFLYLANEKKVARATATIALCGIRFFFEQTLRREWTTLRFVRPAREHQLPVVLSRDEVRRVLAAVRMPVYRMCLTTIYACGLRLRYYGLWSPTRRSDLERARQLLQPALTPSPPALSPATLPPTAIALPPCPLCHAGTLILIGVLRPWWRGPP